MRIIFTQHALLQIKIRVISLDNVIECVKKPEKEVIDEYGNMIAQKTYLPYLLRVIYRLEQEDKIIITAYKTSRLKKYQ
jgi:hypothetical protein